MNSLFSGTLGGRPLYCGTRQSFRHFRRKANKMLKKKKEIKCSEKEILGVILRPNVNVCGSFLSGYCGWLTKGLLSIRIQQLSVFSVPFYSHWSRSPINLLKKGALSTKRQLIDVDVKEEVTDTLREPPISIDNAAAISIRISLKEMKWESQ